MGTDIIEIRGLKVFANHGVYESEKENGQIFLVDITMLVDLCKPKTTDDLSDTVNYASVCEFAADFLKNTAYDLIEKAAYELSKELLIKYNNIEMVNIKLHKPNAPLEVEFEDVSVSITNKWSEAYVAVGSNMGDKKGNIKKALCQLENDDHVKDFVSSKLIKTKPYGGVEQDDFLNGAVCFKTVYDPYELLDILHELEHEAGRVRSVHWGPRTLDLDILFYDNLLIDSEDLKIPHIDMENRDFVLSPLMELCPEKLNPRTKKTVMEMYNELNSAKRDSKKQKSATKDGAKQNLKEDKKEDKKAVEKSDRKTAENKDKKTAENKDKKADKKAIEKTDRKTDEKKDKKADKRADKKTVKKTDKKSGKKNSKGFIGLFGQ
ncbi:MAG: 2-amino-4-hydroxy-6-hydroxymethyldihydropteridine diphosphokinase [Lachnospiraceae bacterium]|nr:2-amino-4-hydroxy-6-hydroxymethyldihydropteridine diphosphokinase [Lachnospiraceae bacterium]